MQDNNIDPSNSSELLKEQGYPGTEAPPVGAMPAGNAKYSVPHYDTFQGIYNLNSRTYRYTFDDAMLASLTNARAMRRDPVLMQALRARQMPTCQLSWHLEPQDSTDESQMAALEKITKIIKEIPRFQQLKMNLLEAIWYGRYGTQIVYHWDYTQGEKRMVVANHVPVNGDKLTFKYSGDVGLLVSSMYKGDTTPTDRGFTHFLTPMERESFIVHHFEPEDADYQQPELAGGIEGVGVRGRLYWFWFQKQNIMALLMDYLQRCALGFTIYYFDAANKDSLTEVMTYANKQSNSNVVFFPRYRDNVNSSYGVERIEPGVAGADLLYKMVEYFDEVMVKYIMGQTLSSTAMATGIGSGLSDLHGTTFQRIIKSDVSLLDATLTTDLISVLYKYNAPNVPPARFVSEVNTANATDLIEAAQTLYEMGLPLNGDELMGAAGLAPVTSNSQVVSKLGAMSPAAISQPPEAVPMQGTNGPVPQQQPIQSNPSR